MWFRSWQADPVGPSRGPPPTGSGPVGTTGGVGQEAVCGLVLGAVEAGMPLRSRRMDSEGLAGSGGHWSTPRTF